MRAKIPVYWIADVPEQQVEVYTQPQGVGDQSDYAQSKVYGAVEYMLVVIEGIEVGRVSMQTW